MGLIEVPFILGAGSIVLAAVIDKTAEDLGWPWLGVASRAILTVASVGSVFWFLSSGVVTGFLR